jgi:hypothetical protein
MQEIVTASTGEVTVTEHEKVVECRFEDEIQRGKGFAPIVRNKQLLDQLAQGLPSGIVLPISLTSAPKLGVCLLKLTHPICDALDATHFVGSL